MWNRQISQKNRNMIRKAEREGVEFEVDEGFRELAAFRELYAATMERLGADAGYRFGAAYFERMAEALRGKGFLAHCRHRGRIVASAIFMHWDRFGHYHLSGSLREAQRLAPNNLLLYRAALELKARGCRVMHLGGGTSADPADPLFKFKLAFSPHRMRFHFGKRVFDEKAYARVRDAWLRVNPDRAARAGSRVLFYKD
jgi:serine/alanine adding enzyme